MQEVKLKPLSVNRAWVGRQTPTRQFSSYKRTLGLLLRPFTLPEPPFLLYLEFGLSHVGADWDNPIKPTVDAIQDKYGFNDRDIHGAIVTKEKVKKGEEYIRWDIVSLNGKCLRSVWSALVQQVGD